MRVVISAIVNRTFLGLGSTAQDIYDYSVEKGWGVTFDEVQTELDQGRIMFRYLASTDAACNLTTPEPEGDPTYCINMNMVYGANSVHNAMNRPARQFLNFALAMRGRAFPTNRLYLADPTYVNRPKPCSGVPPQ